MLHSLTHRPDRQTLADVQREWDELAALRFSQITSGRDFSYSNILEPTVIGLLENNKASSVLDVGCGVGILTCRISSICNRVVGLDVSEQSISIAKEHCRAEHPPHFIAESVQSFAGKETERFDTVVANMMLMSSPELLNPVRSMSQLMTPTGRLIVTISHPWFWPKYWGYETAPWFSYDREVAVDAPFAISADEPSQFRITHIHRPLEQYINAFRQCDLSITSIVEPSLPVDSPQEYRLSWKFPRFLAFCCKFG